MLVKNNPGSAFQKQRFRFKTFLNKSLTPYSGFFFHFAVLPQEIYQVVKYIFFFSTAITCTVLWIKALY